MVFSCYIVRLESVSRSLFWIARYRRACVWKYDDRRFGGDCECDSIRIKILSPVASFTTVLEENHTISYELWFVHISCFFPFLFSSSFGCWYCSMHEWKDVTRLICGHHFLFLMSGGWEGIYSTPLPNLEEENSAIEVVFQLGILNPRETALSIVMSYLLEKPVYHQLRTVEQIGSIFSPT